MESGLEQDGWEKAIWLEGTGAAVKEQEEQEEQRPSLRGIGKCWLQHTIYGSTRGITSLASVSLPGKWE